MLGISIYFQDFDLEYLKQAKECGAKYAIYFAAYSGRRLFHTG